MILRQPTLAALADVAADVCVIGAGPVGIATARALHAKGFRVLVLESGTEAPTAQGEDLARAASWDPDHHFEPHTAVARRLGGTSTLWAGRCVPFDPVDFRARPGLGLDEAWPVGPDDLAPHLAPALAALDAGAPVFSAPVKGLHADDAVRADMLERWSNTPQAQRLHGAALAAPDGPVVALGVTVTGLAAGENGHLTGLDLHLDGAAPGQGGRLPATRAVLAAGGNASTRLMLLAREARPDLFGGPDGPLGRFYMGHVSGQIADIVFDSAALHDALDYHVDAHGSYVRRRLVPSEAAQGAAGIANVAFWPVVPRIAQAAHRSGPRSAVFLALSVAPLGRRLIAEPVRLKHVGRPPYRRGAHALNVIRDLPRTLTFAPSFLWKHKVAKMRLPGFFLRNPARRYGLEFHSEQLPNPDSRLTLAEARDRLGQRRLAIDLRFSEADAASVLRAHDLLEAWLARNDLARLDYYEADREARAAAVLAGACDGAHQIGTIRMGEDRRRAVVDGRGQAFDMPGLFVVSTAVLPTSGQANPTLTAVQFGLRLAEDMAEDMAEARV